MTAYELADRLTYREFVQWDEFYALEAKATNGR